MPDDRPSPPQRARERPLDQSDRRLPRRSVLYGAGGAVLGGAVLGGAALGEIFSGGDRQDASDSPSTSGTDVEPTTKSHQSGGGCCWEEVTKLTAADASAGDRFGASLALSAGTLLVGAPGIDSTDSGTVYVFTRSDVTWEHQQTLTGATWPSGDEFGTSVALTDDGTLAVVGAPTDRAGTSAAYVFENTGDDWNQRAQFIEPRETSAQYGTSVDVDADGDVVLVGDPGADRGAVSVHRDPSSNWSLSTQFRATTDRGTVYGFGDTLSVDAAGESALVGAPRSDSFGLGSGAAFAFERRSNGWQQVATLIDVDGDSASYGTDVAVDADGAVGVVGAPVPAPDTANPAGYVTVVTDRDGWRTRRRLQTPVGDARQTLGTGVDVSDSGRLAVAGDAGNDIGGNDDQGSLAVFARLPSRWSHRTTLTAHDGAAKDGLGTSVAVGDVVAAGAPGATVSGERAGAVYLYDRTADSRPGVASVDDFERSALDDYVSLAGPLDDWRIQSETVSVGDRALQYQGGTEPVEIASLSGRETYPEAGDVFRFDFRPLGDWEFKTSFNFGQQPDAGFHDRYELELDPGLDTVRLQYDDPTTVGDTTIATTNLVFDRETFYTVDVDWLARGDQIVVTVYDGEPVDSGTTVTSLSAVPPANAPTDGGIGFFANGRRDRWVYDDVRIVS